MCGFVGFIDKNKDKKLIIKQMADKIKHRGPDAEGYHIDNDIALGFRRLSIIDLSNGNQPMYNEDKTLVITFNGEIYNYQILKAELIKCGHIFKTNCDTEVLLHGYEEYGVELLNKLRGMFAFVIYDSKKKELFGVRDFYGIKPFYYATMSNSFMFGSEIKSFLAHPDFKKELNKNALENYLTFQYSPGSETFFKNVYKLEPGHYFIYKNNKINIKKYYEIKFEPDEEKSLDYWTSNIDRTLSDSILAHKISDVEVGSFLSSGVDSSYIATKSNVNKTFTVGFANKKYSEVDYAKDLSKKIEVENISKIITKEEYFKEFPKIQYFMDEPLADPSAIALYFVANVASKHVKVSLSGEGADEIYGGYNVYQEPLTIPSYYKIPYIIRKIIGKIASLFPEHRGLNFFVRRGKKLENRFVGNAFMFDTKEKKKLLAFKSASKDFKTLTKPYYDKVKNQDDITKMQYIDFNFWLIGDILLKADKMSMANSLEVRVPFLDKEVIELGLHIPTKFKVDKKTTKSAFRLVANKVLADKVANKKKLGFPVPIREWMKEEDTYNLIKETFMEGNEFFNTKQSLKLLEDHYNCKKDNSRKIWTLYTFLVWYKQYFN